MKTKTAQHTPGDWGITPGADYDRDAWLVGPNHPKPTSTKSYDDLVAVVYKEEDAILIAAAPELLEALQKMVDTFTGGTSMQHAVRLEAIEAIDIARAEGRE